MPTPRANRKLQTGIELKVEVGVVSVVSLIYLYDCLHPAVFAWQARLDNISAIVQSGNKNSFSESLVTQLEEKGVFVEKSSLAVKQVETVAMVPTLNPSPVPTPLPTISPTSLPTISPTSSPTNRLVGIPQLRLVEATSLVFTEDSPPLLLFSSIEIEDANSDHLIECFITISGDAIYGDLLTSNENAINATLQRGKGFVSLSLSGKASVGDYRRVLRKVSYENTADYPSTGKRVVNVIVRDDEIPSMTSEPLSVILAVKRNNERPAIHVPAVDRLPQYLENSAPILVLPTATLNDLDNVSKPAFARMYRLTAQIARGYQAGADRLQLTPSEAKKWEVIAEDNGRVLKVENQGSIGDYEELLRNIEFMCRSDNPSSMIRVVTVVVSDFYDSSLPQNITVNVSPELSIPISSSVLFFCFKGHPSK